LTKITYPGKESEPVTFSYQNGNTYSDYYSSYSQTTRIVDTRNLPCSTGCSGWLIGFPDAGSFTNTSSPMISYSSPLIQTITWKNVTISFSYSADRLDKRKDRITSLSVKYGANIVKQATFDNNVYFGNSSTNYRLKLKGITIKGSNTTDDGDKYAFNYYNDTASLPNYEMKCHDDYWGYYNGTNSDWTFPNDINIDKATGNTFVSAGFNHSVYSTDRKPNLNYTKTCVLKEIIYPTKGKSVFDYELNQVPGAYQYMSSNSVGGLRLRQRTNYSDDNTVTDDKTYTYEGYPTQVLTYDLFVYAMRNFDRFTKDISQNGDSGAGGSFLIEYPTFFFVGTPLTSLSGWTGSNVFYTKVKEYNGTQYSYDGWTEYNYEEENRYLNTQCSWNTDEYAPYMYSKYSDCDKGNIQGLLKSVITYNKSGSIVKKEEKQYQNFSIPSIHTGVRVFQNAIYPKSFLIRLDFYNSGDVTNLKQSEYQNCYLNWIYAFDTYAFRDVSLPSSVTETDYVNGQATTSKVTSYSYDIKDSKPTLFTPSSETVQNSNGDNWVTKTFFPYSDSYKNTAPYNTMVTKNMLNYPIEVKIEKGSNSQFINQTVTAYKQVSGMILPNILSLKNTSAGTLEERIIYSDYDSYGNPVYIIKDNADKVVYLWGYRGMYPIAEIQGVAYSDVTNKISVSTIAAKDEPADTDWNEINGLRTSLPNALITVYKYKPLVGMKEKIDPRGVVTLYEYDVFGRLQKVTQAGKVIESYDYHYKN